MVSALGEQMRSVFRYQYLERCLQRRDRWLGSSHILMVDTGRREQGSFAHSYRPSASFLLGGGQLRGLCGHMQLHYLQNIYTVRPCLSCPLSPTSIEELLGSFSDNAYLRFLYHRLGLVLSPSSASNWADACWTSNEC